MLGSQHESLSIFSRIPVSSVSQASLTTRTMGAPGKQNFPAHRDYFGKHHFPPETQVWRSSSSYMLRMPATQKAGGHGSSCCRRPARLPAEPAAQGAPAYPQLVSLLPLPDMSQSATPAPNASIPPTRRTSETSVPIIYLAHLF